LVISHLLLCGIYVCSRSKELRSFRLFYVFLFKLPYLFSVGLIFFSFFKLLSNFALLMGEEKILETIDVLLQLIPHGCIKAIDQVFLEVADHALVGVTIGMGATGE